MHLRLPTALAVLVSIILAASSIAMAASFSEDFTKPAGTNGAPAGWTFSDTGFTLTSGVLSANPPENKIFAEWTAVPIGKVLTVTAKVTAGETTTDNWKVAGIGVLADEDHYWHLALVEGPDADGKKHSAEIVQQKDGNWGGTDPSYAKLTFTTPTGGFDWKPGVTYDFKIVLTPSQLDGTISEAGVVKFEQIAQFTGPAVTAGRPMLDAGGLKARFSAVTAVTGTN
ncbi:MAG: hypothetical protein P4L33_01150 [Capsulimonadaceae bacterium]|nr:hypothetical protein [Capsulimonadaceae bacterium]